MLVELASLLSPRKEPGEASRSSPEGVIREIVENERKKTRLLASTDPNSTLSTRPRPQRPTSHQQVHQLRCPSRERSRTSCGFSSGVFGVLERDERASGLRATDLTARRDRDSTRPTNLSSSTRWICTGRKGRKEESVKRNLFGEELGAIRQGRTFPQIESEPFLQNEPSSFSSSSTSR